MAFPAALYTHTGLARGATFTQAQKNALGDELAGVEATLGTGVAGTAATVTDRLAAVDALLDLVAHTGAVALAVSRTNATTVAAAADLLGVEGYLLEAVSVSAAITAEGKNGFDNLSADAEDASTWYYVWVGYNPTSLEVCGLLSKAATRAGLVLTHASLSGFTAFRRVGAVYNDGSSDFVRFRQSGTVVAYDQEPTLVGVTADATWRDAALLAPPTARLVHAVTFLYAGTYTAATLDVYWRENGSTSSGQRYCRIGAVAGASQETAALTWMATDASQTVEIKTSANITSNGGTVFVGAYGYVDPVG